MKSRISLIYRRYKPASSKGFQENFYKILAFSEKTTNIVCRF
jgi:hypothetical protein